MNRLMKYSKPIMIFVQVVFLNFSTIKWPKYIFRVKISIVNAFKVHRKKKATFKTFPYLNGRLMSILLIQSKGHVAKSLRKKNPFAKNIEFFFLNK